MPEANDSLVETIRQIALDVRELDPNDQETLVNIGVKLEEALHEIPEDMEELTELFNLCLEALQAIYQETVPDGRGFVEILAESIEAAAESLQSVGAQSNGKIDDVARALSSAMGCEETDAGETDDPAPPAHDELSPLTLDDAAALLVQIEPDDVSELTRVQQVLKDIAEREATAEESRELLAAAAGKIDQILHHNDGSNPDNDISEVGRLIEEALNLEHDEGIISREPGSASDPDFSEDPESVSLPPEESSQEDAEAEMLPADADKDLLGDFIMECREYIQEAETALLSLETDPGDTESINSVFRAFHTIKGTSAFLGLSVMSELAHKAESLLSRVREGEIKCIGGYSDLALRSVDMLKELIQVVQDALGGQPMEKPDEYDYLIEILSHPEGAGVSEEYDESSYDPPRLGDILVAQGKAKREDIETVVADKGDQPIGVAVLRSETASLPDVAKALRTQQRMKGQERSVEASVRVRTERLDMLIEMVGELVIAHSMVAQDNTIQVGGFHDLSKKVTHAGKIVRELQDLSMSMRMVPLKGTFQKMARLVRDLAHKSGKLVDFVTMGEETEIDRNMVDVIKDPLVHMMRNAIDHGIETPEVREGNNKPRTGMVTLSAYHSSGSVVVEIQDDGNGLDRDKIVEKAVSKGLIEPDKTMSDSEVFNLIFEPGFSTADKVTDVSGRGVGMDVVKRGVEALRGRVEISSELGKGSVFSVRMPLTLAITDGMLVRVGGQRYILPTINIYMSLRPEREAISTVAGRGEMLFFRGELIPITRLHRLFDIEDAITDLTEGLLVVVDDGDQHCALLVDEILGQQQVVAKPLGDGIGQVEGISGGAILGDGCVGLILDPSQVAIMARHQVGSAERNGEVYETMAMSK